MSRQLLPFTAGLLLGVVVSMSMIILFYHTQDVTLAEQMNRLSQELKELKLSGAIRGSMGSVSESKPVLRAHPMQHQRQAIINHRDTSVEKSSHDTSSIVKNQRRSPVPDYHMQAVYADQYGEPFIPTLQYAKGLTDRAPPNMTLQYGLQEPGNLKLHFCNNRSESYGAAYLTTMKFILSVPLERWDLSGVICEAASFKIMRFGKDIVDKPDTPGHVMQTLDVLDYSMIHLSAFERIQAYHRKELYLEEEYTTAWHNIDPVIQVGKKLAELNDPKIRKRKITYSKEAKRTIAIMPFLGGEMGEGHSVVGNRFEYLKTCFWSLYEFFPNIAAGVTRQEDVDWAMKESGLPFYDVMKLSNVPEAAGLPSATVLETKRRVKSGQWDFDYMFFTESDQILILRELPMLYKDLEKYPRHLLVPHRLYPYSKRTIEIVHKKNTNDLLLKENDWMKRSCCLPRQNCMGDTVWTMWMPFSDPRVPVMNYYGIYAPLGNGNFLHEVSRPCTLTDYVGQDGYCP